MSVFFLSFFEVQSIYNVVLKCLGFKIIYLFIYLGHMACGILVQSRRIKLMPSEVEARGLKHWTAREVPRGSGFK